MLFIIHNIINVYGIEVMVLFDSVTYKLKSIIIVDWLLKLELLSISTLIIKQLQYIFNQIIFVTTRKHKSLLRNITVIMGVVLVALNSGLTSQTHSDNP